MPFATAGRMPALLTGTELGSDGSRGALLEGQEHSKFRADADLAVDFDSPVMAFDDAARQ